MSEDFSVIKVGIIDYGAGNITNVQRAFDAINVSNQICVDPELLQEFDRLVLPGVGSFHFGMNNLETNGMDQAIQELVGTGTPLLGICLGMQLMADTGEEGGFRPGLGLVPGVVQRLEPDILGKQSLVPHMGWARTNPVKNDNFSFVFPGDYYFAHSYHFVTKEEKYQISSVGENNNVTAAVANKNVIGLQFHPEKSSNLGLQLLKNWSELDY